MIADNDSSVMLVVVCICPSGVSKFSSSVLENYCLSQCTAFVRYNHQFATNSQLRQNTWKYLMPSINNAWNPGIGMTHRVVGGLTM